MLSLILTVDYELFGDGSGDVRACVVEPARTLLEVCEAHAVPLTIFFEVLEYRALARAERDGRLTRLGYSPADEMRRQLQDAVARGHDAQLHLHPQWLESEFDAGRWHLNLAHWRLPLAPHGPGRPDDPLSIRGMLAQGKAELEAMLRPVAPGYACVAFRAGSWCIQPEADVLPALRETGFRVDSTVAPRMQQRGDLVWYDFRGAPRLTHWRIAADVTTPAPHGDLWEVPIHTFDLPPWRRDWTARLQRRLRRKAQAPAGCMGGYAAEAGRSAGSARMAHLRRLLGTSTEMFDFCALTAGEMEGVVARALRSDDSAPLVAFGHTKAFNRVAEMLDFFTRCERWRAQGRLEFTTFPRWLATMDAPSQ